MPVWLIVAGAVYLAVSFAFLLAMGRAAARGDRYLASLTEHRPSDVATGTGDPPATGPAPARCAPEVHCTGGTAPRRRERDA